MFCNLNLQYSRMPGALDWILFCVHWWQVIRGIQKSIVSTARESQTREAQRSGEHEGMSWTSHYRDSVDAGEPVNHLEFGSETHVAQHLPETELACPSCMTTDSERPSKHTSMSAPLAALSSWVCTAVRYRRLYVYPGAIHPHWGVPQVPSFPGTLSAKWSPSLLQVVVPVEKRPSTQPAAFSIQGPALTS
eukprot:6471764-Amphidinium_carterae.1